MNTLDHIIASDVLIIGSGGAGLSNAIALHDAGIDVHVVGKCKKGDAHTTLARGGINAALGHMDPQDNWQTHAADTIRDGGHINDTVAVELLCQLAPEEIQRLADWGTPFNREKDGRISQRFFGAARYRRACFIGDYTGKAILDTLVKQATTRRIPFSDQVYIFSLLQHKGTVNGALGLDINTGDIITFHAKAVVLATGGHSRIFSRSSSRISENNADGIKLAHDLGAQFMDMEMFQFHPTGMVAPPHVQGTLVTEAVRAEGGLLKNSLGECFMEKYDPKRMELSARDIVARAIYTEIQAGRGTKNGGVYLDITHRPKKYILEKLPTMYQQFKKYLDIDISQTPMEVSPTAHYSMGGIFVNHATGKTSIPHLYAIGEVAAGLHGGNRLGGNSLAEIVVFGRLTAQYITEHIIHTNPLPLDKKAIKKGMQYLIDLCSKEGKPPAYVRAELEKMMWDHVGVIRDGKSMHQAIKKLQYFKTVRMKVGPHHAHNQQLIDALDVKNMIPTCEMVLLSAIHRKESRAAHARTDYPDTRPQWKKNILCTPTSAGIKLTTRSVPPVPSAITKLMQESLDYNHERHLLE